MEIWGNRESLSQRLRESIVKIRRVVCVRVYITCCNVVLGEDE
jgi:hypothetical protein